MRQPSSLRWAGPWTVTPGRPDSATSHSSNRPPAPSLTLIPEPVGLLTLHRRTVGRAPPRTSMPEAEAVCTVRPLNSGVLFSIRTAGAAVSCPSMRSSCTVAEPRTVSGTPSGGAIRAGPSLASPGPRTVTDCSITRFSR